MFFPRIKSHSLLKRIAYDSAFVGFLPSEQRTREKRNGAVERSTLY